MPIMKQITIKLDNPNIEYTISVETIVKRKPERGALRGMIILIPASNQIKNSIFELNSSVNVRRQTNIYGAVQFYAVFYFICRLIS